MTPADIHDLITAVSTTKALPPERQRELQSLLIKLSLPPLQFRPLLSGGWLTNGGRWCYDGIGAWVLHLCAHNPDRWLDLAEGRELAAWTMATGRAARSLAAVDGHLAAVLAPSRTAAGQGVRLRLHNGRVQVRWRPPPGRPVAVGVKLA